MSHSGDPRASCSQSANESRFGRKIRDPRLTIMRSMTVSMRSFAKINLGLHIGAPRPDGFHDLLTVYQTINLHDLIHVSLERGSGIEIHCSDRRVPTGETNTCYRMVEGVLREFGKKASVRVEIDKRLPVQGGLGGASANAVTTLLALEVLLKKTLPGPERLRIAADVGSDLPLFLVGGTVLGAGRGEQVYPLPDLPTIPCVVVTPEIGVSTPKAFAKWDQLRAAGARASSSAKTAASAELGSAGQRSAVPSRTRAKLTVSHGSDKMSELSYRLSAWLSGQYSGAPAGRGRAENPLLALVRTGIKNDFEQVVFPEYPELDEAKAALLRAGAEYASLSGSGSTLYGLFAKKAAAETASIRLQKLGWAAQVGDTIPRSAYWRRLFVR